MLAGGKPESVGSPVPEGVMVRDGRDNMEARMQIAEHRIDRIEKTHETREAWFRTLAIAVIGAAMTIVAKALGWF